MESDGRRTIENELIFGLCNEQNKNEKNKGKDKNACKKMVKQI